MTVLRSKDFWAGIMFVGFGLGFVIVAGGYAMGSAARMGPSFFPTLLGGLLALLGLVIALHSLYRSREAIAGFGLRPLIGSVVPEDFVQALHADHRGGLPGVEGFGEQVDQPVGGDDGLQGTGHGADHPGIPGVVHQHLAPDRGRGQHQ